MNKKPETLEYMNWIEEKASMFTFQKGAHDAYIYDSDKCHAEIGFYNDDIIEFSIKDPKEEPIYYLHFQITDMNVAKNYLNDMLETLSDYETKPPLEVLICCCNGATSSYFADKLNRAETILDFGYHFSACGYSTLYKDPDNYDLIILAPQIAFRFKEAHNRIGEKVKQIPAKVFGSYKVKNMLDFLEEVK
ncbi:MAG: hypothetical protein HUJ56_04280 [Erysipelotrichaceae bacterium]|nr:hypothetical protein [Erysipelotrichaceae bacterium]